MSEIQRHREAQVREEEAKQAERKLAKENVNRTAKEEGWPDQDRLDVLMALGLHPYKARKRPSS